MSQGVYTGAWINHTRGVVTGATLTLNARDGGYLIAFLALFVRVAGGHLWNVISFIVFQIRARDKAHDGLHYQHQAILRNKAKGVGAIWEFAKSGWYWKGRATNARWRSILFVTWGLTHVALFMLAGIFSSRVTTAKSEVLLIPQTCGFWRSGATTLTGANTWIDAVAVAGQEKSEFLTASEFTVRCNNATGSLTNQDCLPYGRKAIEWTVEYSDQCPFATEMCAGNVTAVFDSGFLDSRLDFGINAPADEAVQYRKVWKCSPLETRGFVSEWVNASQLASTDDIEHLGEPGEKFLEFYYGRNTEAGSHATSVYGNDSFGYLASSPWWTLPSPYLLDLEHSYLNTQEPSNFIPIPQLNRTDADVHVVLLAKNIMFLGPVNDPWFGPTGLPVTQIIDGQLNVTLYPQKTPVAVVGCTEQHQLCLTASNGSSACTELTSGPVLPAEMVHLLPQEQSESFNTSKQSRTLERAFLAIGSYALQNTLLFLDNSMLALQLSALGTSQPVPENQWVLEFSHWFGSGLTALQYHSMSFVLGPSNAANAEYIKPAADDDEWMCSNQIIRRDDYSSFSTLGLALIVGFGGLFLLVDMVKVPVLSYLQRNTTTGRYRTAEWQMESMLQFQRVTFENLGLGHWEGDLADSIPVTRSGEKFRLALDDTVPTKRPRSGNSSLLTKLWSSENEGRGSDEKNGRSRIASVPQTPVSLEFENRIGEFPGSELTSLMNERTREEHRNLRLDQR